MAPQDAISLANSFITLIKDSAPVFYAIGIAVLLLLSWKRAGSAHFLLGRVWRILGGDKEFTDPYLNTQWKQLRDLEAVRFHTGIRFPSKNSATRTFAWLENNEIALGELSAVKRYFDPEQTTIKNPKLAHKLSLIGVLTFPFLLMMFGFVWVNNIDEAFLTVRKTGTAFWTDGYVAKPWHRTGWSLTKSDCDLKRPQLTEPHDVEVICELLSDPKNPLIRKSINEQRNLNMGIFCLCILAVVIAVKNILTLQLADKLYRKVNPHA